MASGIAAQLGEEFDFLRLERAVGALLERQKQLEEENSELRRAVEETRLRAFGLEERLLEANQSRRDAAKRIDGLISRVAQIEGDRDCQGA